MDIALVASEIAPFSKTGGLADVCGALPAVLADSGHRVITVSPRYQSVDLSAVGAVDTGIDLTFHMGMWPQTVRLLKVDVSERLTHVFLDHAMYWDRQGIYGDDKGSFGDNHIRYALLCRAALEAVRRIPVGATPLGDDCVFHIHDWQTSLLPTYLDAYYRPVGLFSRASTVLTLHNPAHQGRLPASSFSDLELAPRWFSPHALEFHGDLGMLKAGVLFADKLTTVSPTFAWEITTPDGGFGLDALFRGRYADLTGILNGIDTDTWNPTADPYLEATYSVEDLSGKARCKSALQAELGLPVDPSIPLVGNVGRLDPQKGTELLLDSIPWLANQGAQIVVLGSAAAAFKPSEWRLRELENAFPTQVRAWIGYSERVAHRVEAGSDLFVMPSLFEPCGLNQLYSMRYGTVPVVRRTGGLADSVTAFDPYAGSGTGFTFNESTGRALRDAMWQALTTWRDNREGFEGIMRRGMTHDWSWNAAVPKYVDVYQAARESRGGN